MKHTTTFTTVNAVALLLASAQHGHAQVVADGATNTLDNVTNTIPGDVTVGTNGSFTLLILTNKAFLTNSGNAFIGLNAGANSNIVSLAGTNTRWRIFKDLLVGSNGAFNRLIITNGALVGNSNGVVGSGANSSNNSVVVTGTNSVWTNSGFLAVGDSGSGNTLLITNAGAVQAASVFVGQSAGANNLLSVSDGTLTATNAGGTAVLDVRRGGLVFNGGNINTDQLLLTNGAGTFTFNAGTLVTRSATINNGRDFAVGANVGFAPATWNVRSNATPTVLNNGLIIGSNAANSTLLLTNGATLSVGHTTVFSGNHSSIIGFGAGSTNNFAVVAGPNSLWTNSAQLHIGESGSANTLLITNGGRVAASDSYLGYNAAASNNRVIVTSTNSVWANGNTVYVGYGGSGNTVVITNGGAVSSPAGVLLAAVSGSSNNQVIVTGPNSQWSGGGLTVGNSGENNSLLVTNGGRMMQSQIILGFAVGANNNQATVTGSNSLLTSSGNMVVGFNGSGNTLLIAKGGQVTNASVGYAGQNGQNNRVTVTDPGSSWINGNFLSVGNGLTSGNNTLEVANGATVASRFGIVGNASAANGNLAIVTGPGSVWSNYNGDLKVGNDGQFNTALVTNGGLVTSIGGSVGFSSLASSNQVIVTGANSLWNNSSNLTVGDSGAFSTLLITNGGRVANNSGVIGNTSTGSRNQVVVTGANSLWNNSSNLTVGDSGAFSTLLITNGGRVANNSGVIGNTSTGSRNQVVVTGANSVWTNSGDLRLGNAGPFNSLVISNGGHVASGIAYIGFASASNQVTVTGTNSLWTNSSLLLLGFAGAGNTLLITNGGRVANSLGRVGSAPSATDNQITVAGPGSAWINRSDLSVGELSARNSLLITNGGRVTDIAGFLGRYGDSNQVTVTGAGSVWSNASFLEIGYAGSSNQLLVTNGGAVQAASVIMGSGSGAANLLSVGNGTLTATNAASTAVLDVRRGSAVLNGGTITADQLVLNNDSGAPGALGSLTFNSGTLSLRSGTVNNGMAFTAGDGVSAANLSLVGNGAYTFANGLVISPNASVNFVSGTLVSSAITSYSSQPFTVGNSTSAATLKLDGNGTHFFGAGLMVAPNATLTGGGIITGPVTNSGTLSAGNSASALRINGSLSLQSSGQMSFALGGLTPTNQFAPVVVSNFVNFAGSLWLTLVNNLLPDHDDTFTLVAYNSSSSIFSNAVNGGRVNLANNLASFHVSYDTNLVLSDIDYVDSDGDGLGDLQEQAAGTDPNDPLSVLKIISITRTNGGAPVLVDFQSIPGKNYRIEYTTDVASGVWTSLLSPPLSSLATNLSRFTDDGSLTGGLPARRFYRIGLQ